MSVTDRVANGATRRGFLQAAARAGGTLGLGAAGVLAACGPAGSTSSTGAGAEAKPQKGPPVEISFNTWYEVVTAPLVPLIEEWGQENNVKVSIDISPSIRDMSKYTAWYVAGTAPDVVNGENFSWSQFYNSGVILEIGDYLKRDKIDLRRDYVLMGSEIWCGTTYAMPFDGDPRAVYYNKTMLQQAGAKDPWDDLKGQWTFDDMQEIMTKVKRVTGNAGTDVYGVHMGYTGMSEAMGMFVWSFGGKWADYQKMQYTLDSPESLAAHEYVYDWYNQNLIMPNAVRSEIGGGEKPLGLGRAAFRIRAAASHSRISQEIAGNFEYDIAPFPGRRKGQPGVTIVSGNPHTVSKTTKHPDQSYGLMKFLAGPVAQGFWAKNKTQLPTLKAAQEEFVKDPKLHTRVFADAYKVPYGIHFRHNNTSRHYGEYGKAMGEVYAGQKTMSDTLKAFTERVNREVEYGDCLPYKGMTVPIKP
ncbi:MAG: ABC transporter substrate-binding protein [Chloroflexota bacterium]